MLSKYLINLICFYVESILIIKLLKAEVQF